MTDTAHSADPWKLDVPYAVLQSGLRAIAADAVAREDYHTAAYAYSVLAGEPIPPATDLMPSLEPDREPGDSPSYLALELALRKVREDSAGGMSRGAMVRYIDRVLANDLGDPAAGA